MREALKETAKLRQGVDEVKCSWVIFPNAKQYLLPIVDKDQKLVPVFNDDGTVTMKVEIPDMAMAELVQKFYFAVATVKGNVITATMEVYSDFMTLVRHLLLKNYDLTNDDLASILTLTRDDFKLLFANLMRHILT